MNKKELDLKREAAEKIDPELKALIEKYGHEAAFYTWNKIIERQRQIHRAEEEARAAQAKLEALRKTLENDESEGDKG